MAPRYLVGGIALLVAACASSGDVDVSSQPPDPTSAPDSVQPTIAGASEFAEGEMVASELPRSEGSVSGSDLAAVVNGDRALGLDLIVAAGDDGNLMVSPYSVATALSMVYAGARGDTAEEMADVMHLAVDDDTLHLARNTIERSLSDSEAGWEPPHDDDTRDPFALRPANSAWGQGGYPFLDEYLEILATQYGSGLRLVDFVGHPDGATDAINTWTEEATEGRVADLIPPEAIDRLTRLVLINAIWFQANWVEQFDPAMTSDGPFQRSDGLEVEVPMMRADGMRVGYADTEAFEAVRLPFTGDAAMVVALPRRGTPAELAESLEPTDLDIEWTNHLVELTIPRFEFESDIPLKKILGELGMGAAFRPPEGDEGADLTGIVPDRVLYVSEALHKTFLAVDEHGAEAAAATAMIFSATSAPSPAVFAADRPFLFWIEHTTTGEMLFLGQVADPSV